MEQKSVWLRKEQTSAALGILRLQIAFRRSLQFSTRAGPTSRRRVSRTPVFSIAADSTFSTRHNNSSLFRAAYR
jgi:hypothetical protein